MSDFVAVLKRTLDGLGETTPETRQRVYDKARSTISAKLEAMNPPPPSAVMSRQRNALEDAIAEVERSYQPATNQEPLDELEQVLNSLNGLKNQPVIPPKAPTPPPRPVEPTTTIRPSLATPHLPSQPARPISQATPTAVAPVQRPAPPRKPVEMDDLDDGYIGAGEAIAVNSDEQPARVDRNRSGGLAKIGVAAVLIAAIAAGGYAGWINRDRIQQLVAEWTTSAPENAVATPEAPVPTPAAPATEPQTETAAAPEADPAPAEQTPAEPAGPVKLTQKLNADGSETDVGPANGGPSVGEGTSTAAVTQPAAAPATPTQETPGETPAAETLPAAPESGEPPAEVAGTPPAETPVVPPADAPAAQAPAAGESPAAAQPAALPVGQKAIFYEERTNSLAGSAEAGSIVWSVVQESPGSGLPPEAAIRAEATIPSKDLQLRMTIRRNADKTLPASHIVEIIFITPANFDGGGVANVLRVAMKGSEQDPGAPLAGIPAKISDGFFLIALNDAQNDEAQNMRLLQQRSWLDVPLVYNSGRRALITMEKGIPGEKVFTDVLKAWGVSGSG